MFLLHVPDYVPPVDRLEWAHLAPVHQNCGPVDGGEVLDELTLLTERQPIAHWHFAGEEGVGA